MNVAITDFTLTLDHTPWRLVRPEGSDNSWCVLWLQGFSSTIEGHSEGVIRMAETNNITFALLNYAGHGNSPIPLESATREQQLNEVVEVYDELKKLGYTHIIAIGGSFGSYMAALLAGKRDLAALVLRAPANYPDEEFTIPYRETAAGTKARSHYLYRQNISPDFRNSAVDGVAGYDGCTYVVEHAEDEVINQSIPKSYFHAARHGNYISVPGLQHSLNLMPNPEHYQKIIEGWVATILKATRDYENN